MTLLNWVFCGRSLLLLHLNNRGTERGTVEMHSPDPCSLHHTHPSFFSFLVCVLILVYPCGAFPGQEEEEAADKDNYNQIIHRHMVFSLTSIYSAAYLTATPGRTSCTLMGKDSQTWLLNVIIVRLRGAGKP